MNIFAHAGHSHESTFLGVESDSLLRTVIFWGLIIMVLASSGAALYLKSKAKKRKPAKRSRTKKAS